MISVVIPCYNRAALLPRAIESAIAQGKYAREIIVVDDGSTDNTREVCARYGTNVQYIWQANAGPSEARNAGAKRAAGEWIAFLDSDDYWTPNHLARMAGAIEQTNGAAGLYFSDMQMGIDGTCTLWQMINFRPPSEVYLARDGSNWAFLRYQPMMLQCTAFRKSAYLDGGGLDPRFHLRHDTELFFRLSIGNTVCAVSGVGCVYTGDDSGDLRLTTAVNPDTPKFWEETILLYRQLLLRITNMSPEYRRIARRSLASAHWRLLRLYWKSGKLGKSTGRVPTILFTDPSFALSLLVHRRSDANSQAVAPEYT
jgi:glycosyltransferase involved in cell wall biosynthesis